MKPDVSLYERLGLQTSSHRKELQDDKDRAGKLGFSWVPEGLEKMKVVLADTAAASASAAATVTAATAAVDATVTATAAADI